MEFRYAKQTGGNTIRLRPVPSPEQKQEVSWSSRQKTQLDHVATVTVNVQNNRTIGQMQSECPLLLYDYSTIGERVIQDEPRRYLYS